MLADKTNSGLSVIIIFYPLVSLYNKEFLQITEV